MTRTVRTAIFPVAGMGTRLLPATKAVPKELLPILDTPLIHFAIEEALEAGVERLIFVSHPSKSAIERHVFDDPYLRSALTARGKKEFADSLRSASFTTPGDDVVFTLQPEPLGLGHAVHCAARLALPGPVAVVLPDDVIFSTPGTLSDMVHAYETAGIGHLVATMTVPAADLGRYGILSIARHQGDIVHATGIVEKPAPDVAPSQEAVVGRYILDPSIFRALATQPPGTGGEIQLTDAIAETAPDTGLAGFRFRGQRFDCGSKEGLLAATLHRAAADPICAPILAASSRPVVPGVA